MDYVTPPGQPEGSSYIDVDAATGTEGSIVTAAAIEHPQRELVQLIKAAGLTPDGKDKTQVEQAVRKIAQSFVTSVGKLVGKDAVKVSNNGDLTSEVEVSVAAASDTVAGVVERATDAEVLAGADTVRYVTPKQLKTGLDKKAEASHRHVADDVEGLVNALNAKAPLASPVFSGAPTAPTAAIGTNSLQIATTAFVAAAQMSARETITASGAWVAKQTGVHRVTLIGGGGSGGAGGGVSFGGAGGKQGGTTSFGGSSAVGGSGGGGAATPVVVYLTLTKGASQNTVIGAGGARVTGVQTTSSGGNGAGPAAGGGGVVTQAGGGAAGASNGSSATYSVAVGIGGSGGVNDFGYGGGGGGGAAGGGAYPSSCGGTAGPGGEAGGAGNLSGGAPGYGGKGGNGAVIIEY